MKKLVIVNPRLLGVLPGSQPPELAWHSFNVKSDGVEHSVNEELRASVPLEHFDDYVKGQNSFTGLVCEWEESEPPVIVPPIV